MSYTVFQLEHFFNLTFSRLFQISIFQNQSESGVALVSNSDRLLLLTSGVAALNRFLLKKLVHDKAKASQWSQNPSSSSKTSVFTSENPIVSHR